VNRHAIGNLKKLFFNKVSLAEMKFPPTALLRFYAMQQLWTEDDMNKAINIKAFRKA
jgi:hypothetical protein